MQQCSPKVEFLLLESIEHLLDIKIQNAIKQNY